MSSRAADIEVLANGDLLASMGIRAPGQVFKSTDDGLSWTHVFGDATGTPREDRQYLIERIEIATAPSDSNRAYLIAQAQNLTVEGLWRSDDGGDTWNPITKPTDCSSSVGSDISRGQAWYDLILAVNPTDADEVYVGAINLLRSTNAGSTWSNISRSYGCTGIPYVHPDQHAIVFRPGSDQQAVIGNDGGVYYSSNMTASSPSFLNRNRNYNVTQYYSVAQTPGSGGNLIVGGTQDNGTPKLNGAGTTNSVSDVTGGDGAYTHINQQGSGVGFASNQWLNFHYSTDGGQTFDYLGSMSSGGAFINPSDLDENTDRLFFNYSDSLIGRLNPETKPSATYSLLGPPGGMGDRASHLRASEFAPTGTSTVFIGTRSGRIFRGAGLESGGSPSWGELDPLPPAVPGAISSIEIGSSEDSLLVTISNYGVSSVWLTLDGGSTWLDLDAGSNLPDMPVWWGMFHPDDPTRVLIGTEAGLWYTDDVMAVPVVWQADPDIPITRVVTLRYRSSDRQLLAATHGRGTWTTTVPVLTGVELAGSVLLEGPWVAGDSMSVPEAFQDSIPLLQPYGDAAFNGTAMDYDGAESVTGLPGGVVEWVLVSLRTGIGPETEVANSVRPAFVTFDGSIVGLDGGALDFPGVAPGSYHVVVRHRNHLPVMSASARSFGSGPVVIDFTSSLAVAHTSGGDAMTEVETGLWAMIAGDAGADGQITTSDFNDWLVATKAAGVGYLQADFNLDGQVTTLDFNLFLMNTKAAFSSQVPD
jgi:hypothetical protein